MGEMNGFSVAVTCLAAITFYVGVGHMFNYLRSRGRRELLAFSLTCFSYALYDVFCAGLYEAESCMEGRIWQRGQFVVLPVLSVCILWFVLRFTQRRFRLGHKILTGVYLVLALLALFGNPEWTVTQQPAVKDVIIGGKKLITYHEVMPGVVGTAEGIIGLCLGLYILSLLFRHCRSGQHQKGLPVLLGVVLLFVAVVNDTVVGQGFYSFFYLIEYGYLFVVIGMGYSMAWSQLQLETRLKLSREEQMRLAAAVNEAEESIIVTDAQGKILYVNPCFERMTGYKLKEVLGQTPGVLSSGKQDETFYNEMWKSISEGKVWHGHFANRRKDGTLYEEEATISPVRNGGGEIVNYVAVKRDVTQEKELESQLRQSQKMEAIGQLARKVAHDFTNLLVAIFGNAQLLKSKLPVGSGDLDHVEEIISAANRASAMTSELLAFAHNQPTQLKDLDLTRIVNSVQDIVSNMLEDSYTMEMHVPGKALTARVDRSQIEQIIVQLVINAREAMGDRGLLTIEADAVRLDALSALQLETGLPETQRKGGEFAVIEISDSGPGMADETARRIFEPFFTTHDGQNSSGLGLSTVYGMVEQHRGHITVYSRPDLGTTFRIYLPLTDPAVISGTPALVGNGRKVVVAQHDYVSRTILSGILQSFGFRVFEAEDDSQAAALAAEQAEALVLLICDAVMVHEDSDDLLGRVRKSAPSARVLLSSGFARYHFGRLSWIPSGLPWISAPYSRENVSAAIAEVLGE